MAGKKKLEISLINGSLALEYNDSNHSSEPIQYYPACSIKGIIATYQPGFGTRDAQNQRRNPYDFTDMLKVTIYLEGNAKDVSFDIQQVTNQAGWTANLAGLKQAISDIKDWAAECGCCAETAVLLGEVNANLISILNAIVASDQDIEVLLVRDTGAADVVVQQIIDYTTGTPVYSYKDVDGNAYVPVGPLVYLDPSAVLNLILTQATAINGKMNSLGQKASAASMPVVLSTEQEAMLLAMSTALASGFEAWDTLMDAGDEGILGFGVRNETPTLLTGTELHRIPIRLDRYGTVFVTSSAFATMISALNNTMLSTDNDPLANAPNEGMTTVGGKAVDEPTYSPAYAVDDAVLMAYDKDTGRALVSDGWAGGSGAASASTQRVVIATDQTSIPVAATQTAAAAAAVTSVNDTASSTTLLASNAARRGAMFYNDSPSILYLKLGVTASTSSFTVKMMPEAYYELPQPIYTGVIDGIWSADASGAVRITELT